MPGQIQIVTATKSLQMQINQEFQRTLFILNETLMIIYSESHDKYYIGQTSDIIDRIKRHNSGSEKFTSPYLPCGGNTAMN